MHYIVDFLKRTVVGGLLFLVPVAVVAIIIGKIVSALRPAAGEIVGKFVDPGTYGPFVIVLILCLGLVLISFVAGLLATTFIGHKAVESLEAVVLRRVPGYAIVKSMANEAAASLAQIESAEQSKVVLVKVDEGLKVGIVMGAFDDTLHAVYLPNAPSTASGELMLLSADKLVETDMSIADGLNYLARLGVESRREPVVESR